MFNGFYEILNSFERAGFKDPLKETLSLLDVLSSGAVRGMDEALPGETGVSLQQLIEARGQGRPLEYILGCATFMGMDLACSPAALIPRQETELLARAAIQLARDRGKEGSPLLVVDLGTGSGNLAVCIAAQVPHCHVLACDISPEAVNLAGENVARHGLQSRISLFSGDLFEPLSNEKYKGFVDMVVCNPPYIPTGSLAKLTWNITAHEPIVALEAGAYGIDIFRRVITQSPEFIQPGGVLVLEIGQGQDRIVTRLLEKCGRYDRIRYYSDNSSEIRVVSAHITPLLQ